MLCECVLGVAKKLPLPGDQGLVPDDAIRPAPGITVLHVPSSFTHEQSGMRLTGRGVT